MSAEIFIAVGVWAIVIVVVVLSLYLARLGRRLEFLAQNLERTINEIERLTNELNRLLPSFIEQASTVLGTVNNAAQQVGNFVSSMSPISRITGISQILSKSISPKSIAIFSGILQGFSLVKNLFKRWKSKE